jgi:hypothetical protein
VSHGRLRGSKGPLTAAWKSAEGIVSHHSQRKRLKAKEFGKDTTAVVSSSRVR